MKPRHKPEVWGKVLDTLILEIPAFSYNAVYSLGRGKLLR